MIRRWALFLPVLCLVAGSACADEVSDVMAARQWYTDLKRSAKYARIAIQIGNTAQVPVERAAVDALISKAPSVPFPPAAVAPCRDAAQAVRLFIASASSPSWRDGFDLWDRLGDQCIAAINGR